MAFEALINFFFVTGFLFIFTCKALPRKALLHTIFSITYSRICRSYLPREFAARICRKEFAMAIWRGFFVFVRKSFLYIWANFVYMRANFFYMWANFLFVRLPLLTVFLFVITTVMDHRNKGINISSKKKKKKKKING